MIRLALRQFRTEAIIVVVVLIGLAIVLAVTGGHLVSVNDTFKSSCNVSHTCATALNPVVGLDGPLFHALEFLGIVAPALIGLFFGAPLIAREIETGTFRLAWTQSVTQGRWLAVKFGVVGLAAMAFGGLLTWMANWWASPIDAVNQDRFSPTAIRLPRRCSHRIRRVRVRARCNWWSALAPDVTGHGRDTRWIRGCPLRGCRVGSSPLRVARARVAPVPARIRTW